MTWYGNTRGIPFLNDSGETVPPFACMAITSATTSKNEIVITIRKPTTADIAAGPGKLVFNGEVEVPDGQGGFAILDSIHHATEGSAITAGNECGPTNGSWDLSPSGTGFWKMAADTTSGSGVMLVREAAQSGGESHYLFTLTGTVASGSGTATIRDVTDSTEIATGATLKDLLGHFDGLTSGYRGFCFKKGSLYYALGPYTTKVRWSSPNLEYSRDNASTWLNIDTAEDCP